MEGELPPGGGGLRFFVFTFRGLSYRKQCECDDQAAGS